MKRIKTYEGISQIGNVFKSKVTIISEIITKFLKEKRVTNLVFSDTDLSSRKKDLRKTWSWKEKDSEFSYQFQIEKDHLGDPVELVKPSWIVKFDIEVNKINQIKQELKNLKRIETLGLIVDKIKGVKKDSKVKLKSFSELNSEFKSLEFELRHVVI